MDRNEERRIKRKLEELRELIPDTNPAMRQEVEALSKSFSQRGGEEDDESTWTIVQKARTLERPGTLEYIKLICDDFMEFHGDRHYGDDSATVGGIGLIDGHPITFIGNQKGSSMKENILRNFGQGRPEGYRKVLRLAQQAEKFRRPIVSFIDTQGAFPGIESEERGIGEAIARNLKIFSVLKTPILCFFVGEGGSGGALGIGVGDKLYMLSNAVYSVITPEGFASILLRDPSKAKSAASLMKMAAQDILSFDVVHGVIPEPPGGVQDNPELVAARIKEIIISDLKVLCSKPPAQLVRYRSKKIRSIGLFDEEKRGDLFKVFTKIFSSAEK